MVSVDGLWSPTCSNYETAYFDNQCVLDPLYSPACTGWYYVEEETTENEEYGTPEEDYEQTEVFEPETTYSEVEIPSFDDSLILLIPLLQPLRQIIKNMT